MIYFLFMQSYLNYGNSAWISKSQTKLKILTRQKHAVRMIFLEEKEAHARPLLKEISSLNIYQINISQILVYAKLRNAVP